MKPLRSRLSVGQQRRRSTRITRRAEAHAAFIGRRLLGDPVMQRRRDPISCLKLHGDLSDPHYVQLRPSGLLGIEDKR